MYTTLMKLNAFESTGLEPIGEGEHKKAYIDPEDPQRVILEIKPVEANEEIENREKQSVIFLKGTFYLTKIAHLLLPDHVPDIHQVGESADGRQALERDYVPHSVAHAAFQADRLAGNDTGASAEIMSENLGTGKVDIDSKLKDVGLAAFTNGTAENYDKDADGSVHFLDSFKPWEPNPKQPERLEFSFNYPVLMESVQAIPDEVTRQSCQAHLDRLSHLFMEAAENARLKEQPSVLKKLETLIAAFEGAHDLN